MTATPSQLHARRTLELLLAEQGQLAVPQAVAIVRRLADQVSALHDSGRIHGAVAADTVSVDDDLVPFLSIPESTSVVALDNGEWLAMLPDLQQLDPPELPSGIAAGFERLQAAGIALDPRQIDIAQLGALLCRLLTTESPSSYLRSARVKGKVPAELRPVLERALGCDGQERFADVDQFLAALNAVVTHPVPTDDQSEATGVECEVAGAASSSRPTGDTTPSFVSTGEKPADTSVGLRQPAAVESTSGKSPGLESPLPFTRLGHYEIVARIGRGGMGDVYRGYERKLDRPVAVKVLPADLARQDDFVRRFQAEATAAARLIHPNIIQIYFIGDDAGHHFFAMQFVEGESLADLLARRAADQRSTKRWRSWNRRSPAWQPRTNRGWCIATSSRETSSSTAAAGGPCSPTSGW